VPFNIDKCPRHNVSVISVDYFCVHCYYYNKGECTYSLPSRPKRVVKSLKDVVMSGMGRANK